MRMNWRLVAAVAGVATALAGCGGGTDGAAVVATAVPAQTQAWVQPADTVQDVSPMRVRVQEEGSIPKAQRVALGPMARTQAQVAWRRPAGG